MATNMGLPRTRLSTILLRLGVGAFLLFNGWQLAFHGPSVDGTNAAQADAQGFRLDLTWPGLTGVGEMTVGGFLVIGLLTRLMALPLIGVAGAHLAQQYQACGWWGGACAGAAGPAKACWVQDIAGQVAPDMGTAILLGTAALSLLFSGCGGLGLDRVLLRGRRADSTPPLERVPNERLHRG